MVYPYPLPKKYMPYAIFIITIGHSLSFLQCISGLGPISLNCQVGEITIKKEIEGSAINERVYILHTSTIPPKYPTLSTLMKLLYMAAMTTK